MSDIWAFTRNREREEAKKAEERKRSGKFAWQEQVRWYAFPRLWRRSIHKLELHPTNTRAIFLFGGTCPGSMYLRVPTYLLVNMIYLGRAA